MLSVKSRSTISGIWNVDLNMAPLCPCLPQTNGGADKRGGPIETGF
jgi:hypothetical protein